MTLAEIRENLTKEEWEEFHFIHCYLQHAELVSLKTKQRYEELIHFASAPRTFARGRTSDLWKEIK